MVLVLITPTANKRPYHSEAETGSFPCSVSAAAIPSWPHYGAKSPPQAPPITPREKLGETLYTFLFLSPLSDAAGVRGARMNAAAAELPLRARRLLSAGA